jgi:hypothetical protein
MIILRIRTGFWRSYGGIWVIRFLLPLPIPKTIEIMLNADGVLWQECLGKKMHTIGKMQPSRAEAVMRTIATCLDSTITRLNPILEGELPLDGSRFAGQLPPVVHAPTFAIRKKASAIFSLDRYVEEKIMTAQQKKIIARAVRDHRNILVIGGTGSGKTTLTNAIIHQMVEENEDERIFIIKRQHQSAGIFFHARCRLYFVHWRKVTAVSGFAYRNPAAWLMRAGKLKMRVISGDKIAWPVMHPDVLRIYRKGKCHSCCMALCSYLKEAWLQVTT